MSETVQFSTKFNKRASNGFLIKGVLMYVVCIIAVIAMMGSLAVYFVSFFILSVLFALYSFIKIQKESIIISSNSIIVRKREFEYSEYKLFVRYYKGIPIYITGQKENSKQKVIVVDLRVLEIEPGLIIQSIEQFTTVEIEEI